MELSVTANIELADAGHQDSPVNATLKAQYTLEYIQYMYHGPTQGTSAPTNFVSDVTITLKFISQKTSSDLFFVSLHFGLKMKICVLCVRALHFCQSLHFCYKMFILDGALRPCSRTVTFFESEDLYQNNTDVGISRLNLVRHRVRGK